jgi:hypothetical protein
MGVKFNPFTGNLDLIDTTAAAGLDGQVQFNSSGLLDGSADFTWDDISDPKVLTLGGDINLDDGGSFQTTLQLVTPTAARTITFPDATGTVGLVAGSTGQLVFNNTGAYSGLSGVTTDGTDITLTGRFISSLNGAASAPPGTFTGTWFTGGTATTTKPQVLIEPTGTTSTAWSTSGTGLGVNAASGFAGNLLDLQVNGTRQANLTTTGTLRLGAVTGNLIYGFNTGSIADTTANRNLAFNGPDLRLRTAIPLNWADGDPAAVASDIGLVRSAAGVVKVTNGSTGDGTISGQHRLVGTAPASATATGTAGDIRYDADYIYICTATNTWKRAAITTW